MTEQLALAKIVLAAVTQKGVDFDMQAIALETGMTKEQVHYVLSGPAYQQALGSEIMRIVPLALTKGLRKMVEILDDEDSTTSAQVAAHRAIVLTACAIKSPTAPPGDQDDELEAFRRRAAERMKTNGAKTR